MKRYEIVASILRLPIDAIAIGYAFVLARETREKTDLIPGVQLPLQYISDAALLQFAVFGTVLFLIIQAYRGIYQQRLSEGFWSEVRDTAISSITWFLFFTAIIYLGNGYLYTTEIPRLIIFFALWIGFFLSISGRGVLRLILQALHSQNLLPKTNIGVLGKLQHDIETTYGKDPSVKLFSGNLKKITDKIRHREIDVLFVTETLTDGNLKEIIRLCRIYGTTVSLFQVPDSIIEHSMVTFV